MAQQQEHVLPEELFMGLDRSGPVPLYHQIASRLEASIQDGSLPVGSRLENEIAFGKRLGLSRPTVRRAIQELVDKGLLVRRRGIGTQVVHGRISRSVDLTSLYDDLLATGQRPSTKVLSFEQCAADAEIAEILGIAPGDPTLRISRVRFADETPIALLGNVLPGEFLDIPREGLERHGLYRLLRARGVTVRVARQRIGARAASEAEAEALGLEAGAPLLTAERVAYDHSGRAVELGRHAYRPDLYSFETTLVER